MANFTNYVKPDTILCPSDYIKDIIVLYDGTDSCCEDYSIALLLWNGRWTLGMRWNRSMREAKDPAKNPGSKTCVGVPISFSHPIWFVIPQDIQQLLLTHIPSYWEVSEKAKHCIYSIKENINQPSKE